MKYITILVCTVASLALYQCVDPLIENPALKILRNQSQYALEIGFASESDTTWFNLSPGDSLTSHGICYSGSDAACIFEWPTLTDGSAVLNTCIVFNGERKLTYQPQFCANERSYMTADEFGFGQCGFQVIYYPEGIHYRFDITDADYALADSIGN